MDAGDVWPVVQLYVCIHLFKHTQTKHLTQIQSMAMSINGGTHAYYEHNSITIMYTILVYINKLCC